MQTGQLGDLVINVRESLLEKRCRWLAGALTAVSHVEEFADVREPQPESLRAPWMNRSRSTAFWSDRRWFAGVRLLARNSPTRS